MPESHPAILYSLPVSLRKSKFKRRLCVGADSLTTVFRGLSFRLSHARQCGYNDHLPSSMA